MVTQRVEARPNIHVVETIRVIVTPKNRVAEMRPSQHSLIFGNGINTLSFAGVRRNRTEAIQENNTGGAPGWRFDPDLGNYVPIGPVKQLRDRYGRFMKEY